MGIVLNRRRLLGAGALGASGLMLSAMTAGAPRHDLITLTGGAIGQGLPNAIGAAIAWLWAVDGVRPTAWDAAGAAVALAGMAIIAFQPR